MEKVRKDRKAGNAEAQYKDATCGTGGRTQTKGLLKLWLSLGSVKHPAFVPHMVELKSGEKIQNKEKWVPLSQVLLYGKEELKARVDGGSIKVRKFPNDPRYPEFQDLTEEKMVTTERVKSKMTEVKGHETWKDFQNLSNLKLEGQVDLEMLSQEKEKSEDDSTDSEQDCKKLALEMLNLDKPAVKDKEKNKNTFKAGEFMDTFETGSALAYSVAPPEDEITKCHAKLKKHLQKISSKSSKEDKGRAEAAFEGSG